MQGEFNEDPTGTQILIDMGINFIPGVGQVCDARDIAACLKKLVIEKRVDEIMIWVTLLLTAIGCVPYAGDVIKAGCKAILKGADDVVLKILRKLDADDVQKAVKILKTKFTSSIDDAIAMVNKWIEKAGNSKYGNRIKGILSSANENLNKAVDFVKKQIDEFEERVFEKRTKASIKNIPATNGVWKGSTVLILAILRVQGHENCSFVEFLCQQHPDFTLKNKAGKTALEIAQMVEAIHENCKLSELIRRYL